MTFSQIFEPQVLPSRQAPVRTVASVIEEEFSRTESSRIEFPFQKMGAYISFLEARLSSSSQQIRGAVSINPRVMHGNPVFRGTRVPLYVVIEELAEGATVQDLVEGYPSLNSEKIKAGLDYVSLVLRVFDA